MKTLDEINRMLEAWSAKYGISIADAQQGSEAWMMLKLGVISASNASKAVAKRDSDTRLSYMAELVAQVCTGMMEEINSKYLDWGKAHEAAARSYYEFESGLQMAQVPFVFKDDKHRAGCSPDGLVSATKGNEIKCPYNAVHYVKFLAEDKIKSEYKWQTQFSMWVLDAGEWDFSQYHPLMQTKPMKTITISRDEETMKLFDDAIPLFIEDMDKMLAKAGIKFGDHWSRLVLSAEVAS